MKELAYLSIFFCILSNIFLWIQGYIEYKQAVENEQKRKEKEQKKKDKKKQS